MAIEKPAENRPETVGWLSVRGRTEARPWGFLCGRHRAFSKVRFWWCHGMPPCHGPSPAARMLGVSRGPHGGTGRCGWGLLSGGSGASWEGPWATAVHTTALEPHDGSNKIRGPRLLIPQALLSTCCVPSTAGGAVGGTKLEAEIGGTFTDDVGPRCWGAGRWCPAGTGVDKGCRCRAGAGSLRVQ